MANTQQATILSPEKLTKLQQPLPRSWVEAAGILKRKKVNPLSYQKQIRKEWDRRLSKLSKIFRS